MGLRWWNEVDQQSGDSHWVFESAEPETRTINETDKRFFWLAVYAQPALWVVLAILAVVRFRFVWLGLVGMYNSCCRYDVEFCEMQGLIGIAVIALALTITNTLAFSRCDKFSQASSLTTRVFNTGGLAGTLGSAMLGRFFR